MTSSKMDRLFLSVVFISAFLFAFAPYMLSMYIIFLLVIFIAILGILRIKHNPDLPSYKRKAFALLGYGHICGGVYFMIKFFPELLEKGAFHEVSRSLFSALMALL